MHIDLLLTTWTRGSTVQRTKENLVRVNWGVLILPKEGWGLGDGPDSLWDTHKPRVESSTDPRPYWLINGVSGVYWASFPEMRPHSVRLLVSWRQFCWGILPLTTAYGHAIWPIYKEPVCCLLLTDCLNYTIWQCYLKNFIWVWRACPCRQPLFFVQICQLDSLMWPSSASCY